MSTYKTLVRKEAQKYSEDDSLVQLAKSGNERAFRDIVKKHQSRVARVCMGMLGNQADTEDVGQETFIRLYRSLDQYKAQSSLATYLTRIAINLSLNELRRRKKRQQILSKQDSEKKLQSSDEGRDRDINELVNKALQQIDPSFRAVVVLRHIQGYSSKETAQILDVPLGTVLSRLSRAQLKLKTIIKSMEV